MTRGALNAAAVVALLLASTWVYWPGIQGPALLDDFNNVLVIPAMQGDTAYAMDYIEGNRSGPLGRPLSVASFVAERLAGHTDIATSKAINILLHLVCGVLLGLLLQQVMLSAGVASPGVLPWLCAGLWLLAPVNVSTVLYAVQRMAILATLFMVLALLCYWYWRRHAGGRAGHIALPVAVIAAVMAGAFSKENALLVLPLLVLAELLCFGAPGAPRLQRVLLMVVAAAAVIVPAGLWSSWSHWQQGFVGREFTLEERLLTQARVLWDYLGQTVAPDLARLGLYHDDYPISRGLLDPATTLYALLAWAAVLVACAVACRWRGGRLLVFGVCWYLVGHSMEGSIFPLELYFEHRNYFPGMGLFLCLAVALAMLAQRWPETRHAVAAWLVLALMCSAALTSSQVQVWSSRELLALQHINGHPQSARANTDMAVLLAAAGAYQDARIYSARALAAAEGQQRTGDMLLRDISLACIAGQPVPPELVQAIGAENADRPVSSVVTLHTLVKMIRDDVCPDSIDALAFADHMAGLYLAEGASATGASNLYLGLAIMENALKRYTLAFDYTERHLALAPDSVSGLLMKLQFSALLGRDDEAEKSIAQLQALEQAGKLNREERDTLALYRE